MFRKSDKSNRTNVDYPIDFVIPWVDGSDENWLKERSLYLPNADDGPGTSDSRYRDWGTLKYWFRGVETFAPWVHKVFFITWGHLPEWLNTEHEKLRIVNHKEYIPEKYLPTYDSNTIELNLHRIDDLSNQFVLFSDDTFLLKPSTADVFFRDGKPRDEWVEKVIVPTGRMIIDHTNINNVGIINNHFKKRKVVLRNIPKFFNWRYGTNNGMSVFSLPYSRFTGFRNPHLPMSHLKNTFALLWDEEYEKLDRSCQNKFREFTDLNHWLMRYWNLCSGDFVPRTSKFGQYFNLSTSAKRACKYIVDQEGLCVCVNDMTDVTDFDEIQRNLVCAFESILPEKSQFEV